MSSPHPNPDPLALPHRGNSILPHRGNSVQPHGGSSIPPHPGAPVLPLCVDLDGTLVKSDTLVDSVLALVRRNPRAVLSLPGWLLQGKAALKQHVVQAVILSPAHLPYNRPLLDYLAAQQSLGRPIYLASAADRALVERVANHLGLFAGSFYSDGQNNLAGKNKLAAFRQRFGDHFSYIGNAIPDLPILTVCREPMLANPDPALMSGLRAAHIVPAHIFRDRAPALNAWLKAIRLHQWAKNALIFLPLLLAHAWDNGQLPGALTGSVHRVSQLRPLRLRHLHRQRPLRHRSRPHPPHQAPPPLRRRRPLAAIRNRRHRRLPHRRRRPRRPAAARRRPLRQPARRAHGHAQVARHLRRLHLCLLTRPQAHRAGRCPSALRPLHHPHHRRRQSHGGPHLHLAGRLLRLLLPLTRLHQALRRARKLAPPRRRPPPTAAAIYSPISSSSAPSAPPQPTPPSSSSPSTSPTSTRASTSTPSASGSSSRSCSSGSCNSGC